MDIHKNVAYHSNSTKLKTFQFKTLHRFSLHVTIKTPIHPNFINSNRTHYKTTAHLWTTSLTPIVFGTSNFIDDWAEEDEHVLEEYSNTRPEECTLWDDITPKEDPAGSNEGAETKHETKEEPDTRTEGTHASVRIHVPSHLPIAHWVNHEHGNCSNDPAHVIGMIELIIAWVLGRCVNYAPPPDCKQCSRNHRSDEISPLARVPVLAQGGHVVWHRNTGRHCVYLLTS